MGRIPRVRRREDTDIDQNLYPKLSDAGIPLVQVRRNISTDKSGRLRGDLWISTLPDKDPNFEKRIVSLIECKDRSTSIGDKDWTDAKTQGQKKAKRQGLKAFFVTNTLTQTRCYNTEDLSEVSIDGKLVTEIEPIPILRTIQTQVRKGKSEVIYQSFSSKPIPDPKQFRKSLWNIRQTFRSCGISRGSEDTMIKTTLTFCILKLITEKQSIERTLPRTIYLWDDWRPGRMTREIKNTISDITKLPDYVHLKGCLSIDGKLDDEACTKMHKELNQYSFFGGDFDFFGLIYETLAGKQMKKDFGEFYTPRHIIRFIVKLLLKDEKKPRPLEICDPACGTGGFLVEALLYLQRVYEENGLLNDDVLRNLRESIFYGFDTNVGVAIPFARTNMMMVGNSGTNITQTKDSLIELEENKYDYVMANVPYGKYSGNADLSQFSYARYRRFELLFLEKIAKSLKYGGQAAVIFPDGLIETTNYMNFRRNALYDILIQGIVSLPNFAFEPYTTEKTYVIFFTRKHLSEAGKIQDSPVWHYIIDHDGFQEGKKRYPILENDIPELEEGYLKLEKEGKAGFVPMSKVKADSFYSLSSEFYLRRCKPLEISHKEFEKLLKKVYERIKAPIRGIKPQ